MIGLGKMGFNMTKRLLRGGHQVVAYDLNEDAIQAAEVEVAWQLIDPILDGWRTSDTPPLVAYQPGSWGPAEADELIARDQRVWRIICGEHGAGNS